jgi:hypothetical protein
MCGNGFHVSPEVVSHDKIDDIGVGINVNLCIINSITGHAIHRYFRTTITRRRDVESNTESHILLHGFDSGQSKEPSRLAVEQISSPLSFTCGP